MLALHFKPPQPRVRGGEGVVYGFDTRSVVLCDGNYGEDETGLWNVIDVHF